MLRPLHGIKAFKRLNISRHKTGVAFVYLRATGPLSKNLYIYSTASESLGFISCKQHDRFDGNSVGLHTDLCAYKSVVIYRLHIQSIQSSQYNFSR